MFAWIIYGAVALSVNATPNKDEAKSLVVSSKLGVAAVDLGASATSFHLCPQKQKNIVNVHQGPAALAPSRASLDGVPLPSSASPRSHRGGVVVSDVTDRMGCERGQNILQARQELQQGQAKEAWRKLLATAWPDHPQPDLVLLNRDHKRLLALPLLSSLLAQAAQQVGQAELAQALFASLYENARAQGDQALAAHFAWHQGQSLLHSGQFGQAQDWFAKVDSAELLAMAQLGEIQAARLRCQRQNEKKQCERAWQEILALQAETRRVSDPLRPELLMERARCSLAVDKVAESQNSLAMIWSEYPGWQPAETWAGAPNLLASADPKILAQVAGETGLVQRAERLLDASQLEESYQLASQYRGKDSALRCRAKYVMGKSLRNRRRYNAAVQVLTPIVDSCPAQAPKALYLLGRVQGFRGDAAGALASYDKFISRYPKHNFADDVLFFAGDQLTQQRQHRQAHRYYARVVEDYPDGDYADICRWRLAWGELLRGHKAKAIEQLDQTARGFASSPERSIYQQAVYWRARLTLDMPADDEAKQDAIDDLDALLRSDPSGYYGLQAYRLLLMQAPKRAEQAAKWLQQEAQDFARRAKLATLPAPQNRLVKLGHALVEVGLDSDAANLLKQLDADTLCLSDVLNAAADLRTAGRDHEAHWMVRRQAEKQLLGRPDPQEAALWLAAFPRPFAPIVEKWSDKRGLDRNLVWGLMREESAFEAGVVSWAGAVGLMQIMPATGIEEAALDKLKNFSVAQLVQPEINIRLGTSHIGRRLRMFDDNPAFAIAAYNAGPGNVKKWQKRNPEQGIDSYIEAIPVEQTRDYTKRVLRSWAVYRFLYEAQRPEIALPNSP